METWMNQSWWLYDLTVIAILVLCIWGGWHRGAFRSAVGLICYLVAAFSANLLAQPMAETIYDRFLSSYCTEYLSERIEAHHLPQIIQSVFDQYGIQLTTQQLQQLAQDSDVAMDTLISATGMSEETLEDGLLQTIDTSTAAGFMGLPAWMTQALLPSVSVVDRADQLIETAALMLSDDTEKAAEQLTENYIRPMIVSFVKIILFFMLFLLISAVLRVIIKGLSRMLVSDRLLPLDHVIGIAAGCMQAALFLYLMKVMTNWLVQTGADQAAFFQEAVIRQTVLFQYIYYL